MTPASKVRERVNRFKQDLIVEQATELFYHHGYNGTSMDMIAAELGVTKKFLYARYKSKGDILAEIFAQGESIALNVLHCELRTDDPPDLKLSRVLQGYIEAALDHKKLIAVFLAEDRALPAGKLSPVRAMIDEWEKGVIDILEDGKRLGLFNYEHSDLTLHAIMGVVIWTYAWAQVDAPQERTRVVNGLMRSVLALAGYSREE